MTRFTTRTIFDLKTTLIVLILMGNQCGIAQTTPQIRYIYDTIVLRDTIRIRKFKFKEISPLPIKMSENALQSTQNTATFLPKRILQANQYLLHQQKKKVTMKKNAFWAMLLWNLPNLMAQNHVNLSVGSGVHLFTAQDGDQTYMSNPNAHFQIGLSTYRQAFNGRFNYGAGLNYHYMLASGFSLSPLSLNPMFSRIYGFTRVEADYTRNFSTLSLPVYLQWNLKYVKPILGVAYEYKKIPIQLTSNQNVLIEGYTDKPKLASYTHKLSFWGGVEVPLSETYSIRLNYVQEMLGNERAVLNAPSFSGIKNYRFDLTFVAHLSEFGCR
jgi:hypothetical protein